MKKLRNLFLSMIVMLLCCSCFTLFQDEERYIPDDAIFHINRVDDTLGIYEEFDYVLYQNGFLVDMIVDKNDIPLGFTQFASGTGFFITPDIIVTNAHVLGDKNSYSYVQGQQLHTAELLYLNKANDIAFLKAEDAVTHYFKVGEMKDVSTGDPLYVLGYPLIDILGNEIRITNGIVNAFTGIDTDENTFQMSAEIHPGNSGGPVVNKDFEVIGIAHSKLSDEYMWLTDRFIPENVNFAINSSILELYGKEYLDGVGDGAYVSNKEEAANATVLIRAEKEFRPNERQYYVTYSYDIDIDVVEDLLTINEMTMVCHDLIKGEKIAEVSCSDIVPDNFEAYVDDLICELLASIDDYEKQRYIPDPDYIHYSKDFER